MLSINIAYQTLSTGKKLFSSCLLSSNLSFTCPSLLSIAKARKIGEK